MCEKGVDQVKGEINTRTATKDDVKNLSSHIREKLRNGGSLTDQEYSVAKQLGIDVDKKSGSSSVDDIVDIMKSGEMTSDGRNIITQLDDNTKVIFRMDVGENAHSMDMYGYSNPVNHINIEIQVKASSGKYKPKWNFHMILDDFGEVSDSFATGIWTKK